MKYFGAGLSESHKELNRIIRKPELIEQTKELFLEIHGKLHLSVVSGNEVAPRVGAWIETLIKLSSLSK